MTSLEEDLAAAGFPPIGTAQQLADALQETLKTVYKWNERGLPRIRAGRGVRYSRREVAVYLESRRLGGDLAGAASPRK
jgi:hypothetical protein